MKNHTRAYLKLFFMNHFVLVSSLTPAQPYTLQHDTFFYGQDFERETYYPWELTNYQNCAPSNLSDSALKDPLQKNSEQLLSTHLTSPQSLPLGKPPIKKISISEFSSLSEKRTYSLEHSLHNKECPFCEKKFADKAGARYHIMRHLTIFRCLKCMYSCSDRHLLATHLLKHTTNSSLSRKIPILLYACQAPHCRTILRQAQCLKHVEKKHVDQYLSNSPFFIGFRPSERLSIKFFPYTIKQTSEKDANELIKLINESLPQKDNQP